MTSFQEITMRLTTFDILMLVGIAFMVIGIFRSGTLIKEMHDRNVRERLQEAHDDQCIRH